MAPTDAIKDHMAILSACIYTVKECEIRFFDQMSHSISVYIHDIKKIKCICSV